MPGSVSPAVILIAGRQPGCFLRLVRHKAASKIFYLSLNRMTRQSVIGSGTKSAPDVFPVPAAAGSGIPQQALFTPAYSPRISPARRRMGSSRWAISRPRGVQAHRSYSAAASAKRSRRADR